MGHEKEKNDNPFSLPLASGWRQGAHCHYSPLTILSRHACDSAQMVQFFFARLSLVHGVTVPLADGLV
jgi:hypothetical protein